MKKRFGKIGATSLAATMAIGGPAVSVLAVPKEEDKTPDKEISTEAKGDRPLASLLNEEDGFVTDGTDKREQLIPVHFVTAWDDVAGGMFNAISEGDLELSESVKDAVLQRGFHTTEDGKIRNVAVWTFYYDKEAKELGQLPELTAVEGETLNGWSTAEGEAVNEKTAPVDGAVYYANYTSNVTYEELDMIGDLIDRQDTTTSVTWKLDKEMGELADITGEDVVSSSVSADKDNLVAEYKLSASEIVVPEVTAKEGYEFKGWFKEGTEDAFDNAAVEDGDTYVAKFEKVDAPVDPEVKDISFRYHKTQDEVVDFTLKDNQTVKDLNDWLVEQGLSFGKAISFGMKDESGSEVAITEEMTLKDIFAHMNEKGMTIVAYNDKKQEVGTVTFFFESDKTTIGFTVALKEEPEEPVEDEWYAHITLGDKYVDLKSSGGVTLSSAMSLIEQYGIPTKDVARLTIVDGETETDLDMKTTVADFAAMLKGDKLIIRGYDKDNKLLGEGTMTADKEANHFNVDIKLADDSGEKPDPEAETYVFRYHKDKDKVVEFELKKDATLQDFLDWANKENLGLDKTTGFALAGVQDGKDVKLGLDTKLSDVFETIPEAGLKLIANDSEGNVLAEFSFKDEEGVLGFTVALKDTTNPDDGENKPDGKPDGGDGENNGGHVDQGITYIIKLTDTKGNTSTVKGVKSTHTWGEFAKQIAESKLMNWSDVAKWTVKQANVSEHAISEDTKMKEIVDLLKDGDVQVTAYDKDGKALGCAVLTTNGEENSFNVLLSNDTNVTLRTAEEIANKGKGEGEEVSQEGKGNSVAPPVQTADSNALLIYSVAAGALVLSIGGYVVYQRKLKRPEA